jgi:ubiquinone/menaquinone biosynthesis C-methylase UbiE
LPPQSYGMASHQKHIFVESEGDQWFLRNQGACPGSNKSGDRVLKALERASVQPLQVLEIGCSTGSRIDMLAKQTGCKCYGIDPSAKAVKDGSQKFPNLSLQTGTADHLPFADGSFDLIIFGFCLYVCDRQDLFKIAAETDRCLRPGGKLVVYDFYPPFPYRNTYAHNKAMHSYKMDYSKMFSWNPAYFEIYNEVTTHAGPDQRSLPDERIAVTILEKNEESAYILDPHKEQTPAAPLSEVNAMR